MRVTRKTLIRAVVDEDLKAQSDVIDFLKWKVRKGDIDEDLLIRVESAFIEKDHNLLKGFRGAILEVIIPRALESGLSP